MDDARVKKKNVDSRPCLPHNFNVKKGALIMGKKLNVLMIIALLAMSMVVFVACKPPAPAPDPLAQVENKAGTKSENLCYNGDFELDGQSMVVGDGAGLTPTAGTGVGGSKGGVVATSENYGIVYVDMTSLYGRGKSYLVKASFKNDGTPSEAAIAAGMSATPDLTAHMSMTVQSGAVQDAIKSQPTWDDYYDCDDIYGGDFLDAEEAEEIFNVTTVEFAPINGDTFTTITGIIPATTIDSMIAEQTEKYNGTSQTLRRLYVCFYVGVDGNLQNYNYIVDNVEIYDLNSEITTTGMTWTAPPDGSEDE